ncbi:MAG: choice-of-anchor tandem repeat GloVer-containing protein [Bacteroidia bacterium]
MKNFYQVLLALFCLVTGVTKAQYTILLNFDGKNGRAPEGSLTLSGNVLYGMAKDGGVHTGYGCVFSVNTDGTGYKNLHDFDDTSGAYPSGSLILSGNTLFGMTSQGGFRGSGFGNIFSIHTDGTGYKELLRFNGTTNGGSPDGDLLLLGGKLYGITEKGGKNSMGLVFSIDTNGTGYKDLLDFDGKNGAYANGSLCNSGEVLYGMTYQGGEIEGGKNKRGRNGAGNVANGCIFSINTDGSGYKDVYNFTNGGISGNMPRNTLTFSDGVLYGMRRFGGLPGNGYGCIFSINANGTGFKDLYNFNDTLGKYPSGSLTLSGNHLYGMTYQGGKQDYGCIFSINTNGEGFKSLLDFNGNNGALPLGSLIFSGTTFYGMTSQGGKEGDGIIFSLGAKGTQ